MTQCVAVDLQYPDATDFRQNVLVDVNAGDVDPATLTLMLKVTTYFTDLVTYFSDLSNSFLEVMPLRCAVLPNDLDLNAQGHDRVL